MEIEIYQYGIGSRLTAGIYSRIESNRRTEIDKRSVRVASYFKSLCLFEFFHPFVSRDRSIRGLVRSSEEEEIDERFTRDRERERKRRVSSRLFVVVSGSPTEAASVKGRLASQPTPPPIDNIRSCMILLRVSQ